MARPSSPPWKNRTRPCPFYPAGRCVFGDACNFLHHLDEKVSTRANAPFVVCVDPEIEESESSSSESSDSGSYVAKDRLSIPKLEPLRQGIQPPDAREGAPQAISPSHHIFGPHVIDLTSPPIPRQSFRQPGHTDLQRGRREVRIVQHSPSPSQELIIPNTPDRPKRNFQLAPTADNSSLVLSRLPRQDVKDVEQGSELDYALGNILDEPHHIIRTINTPSTPPRSVAALTQHSDQSPSSLSPSSEPAYTPPRMSPITAHRLMTKELKMVVAPRRKRGCSVSSSPNSSSPKTSLPTIREVSTMDESPAEQEKFIPTLHFQPSLALQEIIQTLDAHRHEQAHVQDADDASDSDELDQSDLVIPHERDEEDGISPPTPARAFSSPYVVDFPLIDDFNVQHDPSHDRSLTDEQDDVEEAHADDVTDEHPEDPHHNPLYDRLFTDEQSIATKACFHSVDATDAYPEVEPHVYCDPPHAQLFTGEQDGPEKAHTHDVNDEHPEVNFRGRYDLPHDQSYTDKQDDPMEAHPDDGTDTPPEVDLYDHYSPFYDQSPTDEQDSPREPHVDVVDMHPEVDLHVHRDASHDQSFKDEQAGPKEAHVYGVNDGHPEVDCHGHYDLPHDQSFTDKQDDPQEAHPDDGTDTPPEVDLYAHYNPFYDQSFTDEQDGPKEAHLDDGADTPTEVDLHAHCDQGYDQSLADEQGIAAKAHVHPVDAMDAHPEVEPHVYGDPPHAQPPTDGQDSPEKAHVNDGQPEVESHGRYDLPHDQSFTDKQDDPQEAHPDDGTNTPPEVDLYAHCDLFYDQSFTDEQGSPKEAHPDDGTDTPTEVDLHVHRDQGHDQSFADEQGTAAKAHVHSVDVMDVHPEVEPHVYGDPPHAQSFTDERDSPRKPHVGVVDMHPEVNPPIHRDASHGQSFADEQEDTEKTRVDDIVKGRSDIDPNAHCDPSRDQSFVDEPDDAARAHVGDVTDAHLEVDPDAHYDPSPNQSFTGEDDVSKAHVHDVTDIHPAVDFHDHGDPVHDQSFTDEPDHPEDAHVSDVTDRHSEVDPPDSGILDDLPSYTIGYEPGGVDHQSDEVHFGIPYLDEPGDDPEESWLASPTVEYTPVVRCREPPQDIPDSVGSQGTSTPPLSAPPQGLRPLMLSSLISSRTPSPTSPGFQTPVSASNNTFIPVSIRNLNPQKRPAIVVPTYTAAITMSPESYNQSIPASSRNSSIVSQSFVPSFSDLLAESPVLASVSSRSESISSYRPSLPSSFALPTLTPSVLSSPAAPTIVPPSALAASPLSPNAFVTRPRLPSPFSESISSSSSPALSDSQFADAPPTARLRESWLAGPDGMPRRPSALALTFDGARTSRQPTPSSAHAFQFERYQRRQSLQSQTQSSLALPRTPSSAPNHTSSHFSTLSSSTHRSPSPSPSPVPPHLFFAIASSSPDRVSKVLTDGASPNETIGPEEVPALVLALSNISDPQPGQGDESEGASKMGEIVKALLAHGADPKTVDRAVANDSGNSAVLAQRVKQALNPSLSYFLQRASAYPMPSSREGLPSSIEASLRRARFELIGQDLAITELARCIRLHDLQLSFLSEQESLTEPFAVIFAGPSGHGKTMLASKVGSYLNVPSYHVNMTAVRNLWTDRSSRRNATSSTLIQFLREHEGQRVVVVLDEIEKVQDPSILHALWMPWESGHVHDPTPDLPRDLSHNINTAHTLWIATSNAADTLVLDYHAARQEQSPGDKTDAWLSLAKKDYEDLMRQARTRMGQIMPPSLVSRVSAVIPFVPFTYKERRALASEALTAVRVAVGHRSGLQSDSDWDNLVSCAAAEYVPAEGARSLRRSVMRLFESMLRRES